MKIGKREYRTNESVLVRTRTAVEYDYDLVQESMTTGPFFHVALRRGTGS